MNSDGNLIFTPGELFNLITTPDKRPFFILKFIELFERSHRDDKCEYILHNNDVVPHIEITHKDPASYPTRAQKIQLALIQYNLASTHNKFVLNREIISFKDIKEEREFNSQVYIHFYGEFQYTNIQYRIVVMENKTTLQFYLDKGKNNA